MTDFLTARNSHAKLVDPGPSSAQLVEILSAGARAPDHAWLRPTRLITAMGNERDLLNEAFVAHACANHASAAQIEKAERMALRAPLVIMAVCEPKNHPKVPHWEQLASTSLALGYCQLACESMGYGTMWRTGEMASSARVKQVLKLPDSATIVGFLYVGTKSGADKKLPDVATTLPSITLTDWLND